MPTTPKQFEDFHSDEFGEITDVIFDGDNTIWDWVTYAVHAYEAMSQTIAEETGIPESEVAAAMKRFYTMVGTMEDERLIQGLTAEGFFKDIPNFNCDKLAVKAQRAFTIERDKYLHPYEGIEEVIKTLHARGVKNRFLSDAPARQAKLRIKRAKIGDYFEQVNAMPSRDPDNLPEKFRRKEKKGKYDVNFKVTEIPWEKPYTNLEEILKMTRAQIRKHVVIIGDNDRKDMELVRLYGCRGIHTVYGEPSKDFLKRLLRFAPEKVALKNLAASQNQEDVQNPTEYKGVIIKVDDPREIYDVLNIHPPRSI